MHSRHRANAAAGVDERLANVIPANPTFWDFVVPAITCATLGSALAGFRCPPLPLPRPAIDACADGGLRLCRRSRLRRRVSRRALRPWRRLRRGWRRTSALRPFVASAAGGARQAAVARAARELGVEQRLLQVRRLARERHRKHRWHGRTCIGSFTCSWGLRELGEQLDKLGVRGVVRPSLCRQLFAHLRGLRDGAEALLRVRDEEREQADQDRFD
mmetsp:Transcript_57062/g.185482  ORF Transcript_57062/g.185482 Transcript_57062/m.185482 type:complete len:216 (-) Transcript_57062:440-1087(-)